MCGTGVMPGEHVHLAAFLILSGGSALSNRACFRQTLWRPTKPLPRSSVERPTHREESPLTASLSDTQIPPQTATSDDRRRWEVAHAADVEAGALRADVRGPQW